MIFKLEHLINKHNMDITGIIHVGAHTAEERVVYDKLSVPVIWIEANKDLCRKINVPVINACVGDGSEVEFNYINNTASSSILKPKNNLTWRPELKIDKTEKVKTLRLDSIQEKGFNFLNMDIQGGELLALKGTNLDLIDYIYTEVHLEETYENCPRLKDIDNYLKRFNRVELSIYKNRGWGDALYIRCQ